MNRRIRKLYCKKITNLLDNLKINYRVSNSNGRSKYIILENHKIKLRLSDHIMPYNYSNNIGYSVYDIRNKEQYKKIMNGIIEFACTSKQIIYNKSRSRANRLY